MKTMSNAVMNAPKPYKGQGLHKDVWSDPLEPWLKKAEKKILKALNGYREQEEKFAETRID